MRSNRVLLATLLLELLALTPQANPSRGQRKQNGGSRPCDNLKLVNGRVERIGAKVKFSCNSDYFLRGPTTGHCKHGMFTTNLPICLHVESLAKNKHNRANHHRKNKKKPGQKTLRKERMQMDQPPGLNYRPYGQDVVGHNDQLEHVGNRRTGSKKKAQMLRDEAYSSDVYDSYYEEGEGEDKSEDYYSNYYDYDYSPGTSNQDYYDNPVKTEDDYYAEGSDADYNWDYNQEEHKAEEPASEPDYYKQEEGDYPAEYEQLAEDYDDLVREIVEESTARAETTETHSTEAAGPVETSTTKHEANVEHAADETDYGAYNEVVNLLEPSSESDHHEHEAGYNEGSGEADAVDTRYDDEDEADYRDEHFASTTSRPAEDVATHASTEVSHVTATIAHADEEPAYEDDYYEDYNANSEAAEPEQAKVEETQSSNDYEYRVDEEVKGNDEHDSQPEHEVAAGGEAGLDSRQYGEYSNLYHYDETEDAQENFVQDNDMEYDYEPERAEESSTTSTTTRATTSQPTTEEEVVTHSAYDDYAAYDENDYSSRYPDSKPHESRLNEHPNSRHSEEGEHVSTDETESSGNDQDGETGAEWATASTLAISDDEDLNNEGSGQWPVTPSPQPKPTAAVTHPTTTPEATTASAYSEHGSGDLKDNHEDDVYFDANYEDNVYEEGSNARLDYDAYEDTRYEEQEYDYKDEYESVSSGEGELPHIDDVGSKFRQEFFIRHEVDILSLDSTCMEKFVAAPSISHAEITGYDASKVPDEIPELKFAEVTYRCSDGYKLVDKSIRSLFCSQNQWRGKFPECVPETRGSTINIEDNCQGKGNCSQICQLSHDGQPVCSCLEGFQLASDEKTCEDVDECLEDNGGCSQVCNNRPGTFLCSCVAGYSLYGEYECRDINECLLNNGHGPCQDSCTNTEGSYQCGCTNLPGTTIGPDQHTCEAADGCNVDNGGCSHQCFDSYNQVFCMCPSGYVLGPDWKNCEDVNECLQDNNGCPHLCINTPGSAHCACMPGYKEVQLDAMNVTCTDINECEQDCPEDDWERCDLPPACDHSCVNTLGSFYCECQPGFELSEDGRECVDRDECLRDNGGCSQICINQDGGRECACEIGYRMDYEIGDCQDIDECETIAGVCLHGECVNTAGGHHCLCHQGYEEYAGMCMDINECLNESPCGDHGVCSNLEGSFECFCEPGYKFQGTTCEDLNECDEGNPCVNGICHNMQGGYNCSCHSGFYEMEGVCLDVDECIHSPCGIGTCINHQGGYQCSCPEGYLMLDGTCQDIDECLPALQTNEIAELDHRPCGQHGDCTNLPGSYVCQCHKGFELANNTCEDIDECLQSEPLCIGGHCENHPGSYECHCDQGYMLDHDGHTCIDLDECLYDNGGCGHVCINTPGSHHCSCHSGYEVSSSNDRVCVDVNECEVENGGCEQLCVNAPGGHTCHCNDGFRPEGSRCLDQDECGLNNGGCEQICVNTLGGSACSCEKGYEINQTNRSACVDVDECRFNNGDCDQICANFPGGWKCDCNKGFQILPDGSRCGDLNECTKENGGCSHECINMEGGHACKCPVGWSLGPDGRTCQQEKAVLCPHLKRPKFGFFKCTKRRTRAGYKVGTKCRMRCRPGFSPHSIAKKMCLAGGQWEGEDGECRPVTCPPLQQLTDGVVDPPSCLTGPSTHKTECKFICNPGFSLTGSSNARCDNKEEWKYSDSALPRCQTQFPPPFIMCPPDQVKPLPPGATSVYVMFPQPKTNVDWFRYVETHPRWAKQLEGEMPLGKHVLQFTAHSPFTNQTANCRMSVHIKDTEPPRVTSCPQSFVDYLQAGQKMKRVTWPEPIFKDNVGIQHVMASYLPGHYFPKGRHHILYQAADADGNRARCGFTVTILPRVQSATNYYSATPRPNSESRDNQNHGQLPSPVVSYVGRSYNWNSHNSVSSSDTGHGDNGQQQNHHNRQHHDRHKSNSHHRRRPPTSSQCDDVPEVENGKMACLERGHSKKCTPVCDEGHVFYQKFSSRPPTYLCSGHRVDWKINRFIPDCSPVVKTKSTGICPAGWEERDGKCVACPPGMYRPERVPLCQLCPKGSYAEKFGSQECQQCQHDFTTNSLGTRKGQDCKPSSRRSLDRYGSRTYGRTGLFHYNSWLNEEPYRPDKTRG